MIFKGILRPSIQNNIEYHDADSRYLPKSKAVTMTMGNVYHIYFYQPFLAIINIASMKLKKTQGGNINIYISYIFIALIITLFLVL